jgi:hypothetical protein
LVIEELTAADAERLLTEVELPLYARRPPEEDLRKLRKVLWQLSIDQVARGATHYACAGTVTPEALEAIKEGGPASFAMRDAIWHSHKAW